MGPVILSMERSIRWNSKGHAVDVFSASLAPGPTKLVQHLKVLLDPEANLEVRQAALFYEDCRDGRGLKFLDADESVFEQIQRHSQVCAS